MGFLRFAIAHLWAATLIVIGTVIGVAGMTADAFSLLDLGLPGLAWGAIGFGLFVAGVLAILYRWDQARVTLGRAPIASASESWTPPEFSMPLADVFHQNYSSCTVDISGKKFIQCKFDNVQFHWDGLHNYELIDCGVRGSVGLSIDGFAGAAVHILKNLNLLKEDFAANLKINPLGRPFYKSADPKHRT